MDDDIEEEIDEIFDIEEEDIVNGFHQKNNNFNLLILGGAMFVTAILLYHKYNFIK